jgi:hypothetical protein
MKGLIVLLSLAVAGVSLAQQAKPAVSLRWENVSSRYRRFEGIKPRLVNQGEISIFLSRLYPDGSARLERFNQDSGQWEPGDWGMTCGTVAQATVPIEIKPKSQREIQVYWQLSTDEWETPHHFVVFGSLQQRPLEGHYRFVLLYSLEPRTLGHRPSAIYKLTSPEFDLKGR